ncbi:hypothetical protein G3I13_24410 [Streptomyces sp. SID6673]|nr:hypothetical protein [Streptomyces sp. SID11726]NEB27489.1 hypothetical protein [Streptomyces sp. SID6673]
MMIIAGESRAGEIRADTQITRWVSEARLVLVASCVALAMTGCSGAGSATGPTSSATAAGDGLLGMSDFPAGYELHPGSTSQDLAEQQRKNVSTRSFQPPACAQVFSMQADRTASSQRRGVYAEHDEPYKPSYGDFITRDGETLAETREVYDKCGNYIAVVPGEGEVSMTTIKKDPPPGVDADAFVVETTVTTTPYPANQGAVAAQQKSLIGHVEASGKRVTFYEEIYGFGSTLDAERFDSLFAAAVDRAATA